MKRLMTARVAWACGTLIACAGCDSSPPAMDAGPEATCHSAAHMMDAGVDVDVASPSLGSDCSVGDASCANVPPPYEGACLEACGTAPRGQRASSDGGTVPTAGVHYYLVDSITIDDLSMADASDPATTVWGFDLDGLASLDIDDDGCDKLDLYPRIDRDQLRPACCDTNCTQCRAAVDNVLPDLAEFTSDLTAVDPRDRIRSRLATGHLLTVVALRDVDDWDNDADVGIEMYRAFDANADCTDNFCGVGSVLLDAASFDGASPPGPLWYTRGRLVDGQFYSATPFDGLGVWLLPDGVAMRPVRELRLRFEVSDGGRVLSAGNAGGWMLADSLIAEWNVTTLFGRPETIALVLGRYADLRVDPNTMQLDPIRGSCDESPEQDGGMRRHGGFSEGFGFTAVSVSVGGTAAGPPAGACGAGP